MPRQSRLDALGVLHHVMIRGIERRRIFKDNKDRDNLLERLSFILTETKTSCYAFALMPNHAHFLLRSGEAGVSKEKGFIKSPFSFSRLIYLVSYGRLLIIFFHRKDA